MSEHAPVRRLLGRVTGRVGALPGLRSVPRPGPVTSIAIALIAAQAVFRFWAASRSWFMWDDYIFIADVTRGDADLAWLFHSHFSLIQPVAFAMVWAVAQAGFTWWVYALHITALQVLASAACWTMLRTVFGNRRILLLPLVLYLLSPLTMPGAVWWSVAIYQHPFHLAFFGAITCHVLWLRSRRLLPLVGSFLFVALALGSYLKAPLVVPVLVAISLLWFTTGGVRSRVVALARQWPAWLGYGVLLGGYAWLSLSRTTEAPPPQRCEAAGVLATSALDTVGTGLVGGPLSWRLWTGGIDPFIAASDCVPQAYRGDPDLLVGGAPQSLTSPSLTTLVVATLLLVFLVLHRWARHRDAVLALWIVVPYVLASAAVVYVGRAGTWGSQVSAREIRYFADVALIACFALATALVPIRGALVRPRRRAQPFFTRPLSRGAVQWLVAGFVVTSLVSSVTYVLPWHTTDSRRAFPERAYLAQVRSTVASEGGRIRVADLPLPVNVANPVIYPYNLPSRKLAPLDGVTAVTQGTDLEMLDERGRLRPATMLDGPRADDGPVDDCGYLVQQPATSIDVIPVVPGLWWTRIDYLASADGFVDVQAGPMFRRIAVERGLHSMFFQSSGDFDEVELEASANLTVCVDNVHVGDVTAGERG